MFRVYDGGHLLAEVARTTTNQIARFRSACPNAAHRPNDYLDAHTPLIFLAGAPLDRRVARRGRGRSGRTGNPSPVGRRPADLKTSQMRRPAYVHSKFAPL